MKNWMKRGATLFITCMLTTTMIPTNGLVVHAEPQVQESFGYNEVEEESNPLEVDESMSGISADGTVLPSVYPEDPENAIKAYPATRNQNPYGTCWAFSSMAMAEIGMWKKGYSLEESDFSELQFAYFTNHFSQTPDPIGGTNGDVNTFSKEGKSYLQMGNNLIFTLQALANWVGATDESKAPYSIVQDVSESEAVTKTLDDSLAYEMDDLHMKNGYIIATSQREEVKEAIRTYGVVGTSYCHDSNYYDSATKSYYYPTPASTNHAIALIGWDDNYVTQAPEKGAWLLRNSWTTDTGINMYSYFWISYYDQSINDTVYVFEFEEGDNYDNNYQYDGVFNNYYMQGTSFANVFTASSGSVTECLDAVSIRLEDVDSEYTVQIYTDLKNPADPTSGTLQSAATTTGMTKYEGIYTIPLEHSVQLSNGQTYAVVVSFNTITNMACEYGASSNWYQMNPAIESGQSMYKVGDTGTWYDMKRNNSYYGNLRIKAYTNNQGSQVTGQYAIKFSGNGASAGSMVNKTDCTEGTTFSLPTNNYTRNGYTFTGWNTSRDGSGMAYGDGASVKNLDVGAGGIVTLYAQWEAITYTIHFDANGGTGSMSDMICKYGQSYIVPENPFTRSDATFRRWNTKADGSGEDYYVGDSVSNLLTTTGTITLYARWYGEPVGIRYQNTNGTYNYNNPSEFAIGDSPRTLYDLSKSGYVFEGWYTSENYTNKITQINDEVVSTYAKDGTLVLYAKWSQTFEAPSVLKMATYASKNTIVMYWGQTSGALGYILEYYNGTSWVKLKQTTATSYTHTNLQPQTLYQYRVRAYKTGNSGTVYTGYTTGSGYTSPNVVSNLRATGKTASSITLQWTKGAGGVPSSYMIYRSTTGKSGSYTNIATVAGNTTSYINSGLTAGRTYYYYIATCMQSNGYSSIMGGSTLAVDTIPATVTGFKQSSTNKSSIKLTWTKNTSASGYQIYRSTSSNGSYSKIATIKGASTVSYTDKSLSTSKTYYYKIRAYRTANGANAYSSWSSVLKTVTSPGTASGVKCSSSASSIKVSWNKVSGASGYRIYYRNNTKDKWMTAATVNGGKTVSYTHSKLSSGKTYYYYVKPYRSSGSYNAWGTASSSVTTSTKPAKVANFKQSKVTKSSVKLSWSKVGGASGYQIYRASSSNGKYSKIATISKGSTTSYTNSKLNKGKNYYYKICAYRTVNKVTYNGASSSPVKCTTLKK